uniref:Uncharacterized protein n=1 Tax=Ciona savignyi TaxID=51511 RepID=H2YNG6_CIOSA
MKGEIMDKSKVEVEGTEGVGATNDLLLTFPRNPPSLVLLEIFLQELSKEISTLFLMNCRSKIFEWSETAKPTSLKDIVMWNSRT